LERSRKLLALSLGPLPLIRQANEEAEKFVETLSNPHFDSTIAAYVVGNSRTIFANLQAALFSPEYSKQLRFKIASKLSIEQKIKGIDSKIKVVQVAYVDYVYAQARHLEIAPVLLDKVRKMTMEIRDDVADLTKMIARVLNKPDDLLSKL
jgi:hypothetical protein